MTPRGPAPACWVVSDGTAGMEVQSVALARGLGFEPRISRITPLSPLRLAPWLGRVPGMPPAGPGHDLQAPYPQVAIGCGRRNAGAVIALKRLSGGRTLAIQIQDPRSARGLFDILVVPDHDPATGPNVVATRGSLNGIDDGALDAAAQSVADRATGLPRPLVAVNIGGDTRAHSVGPGEAAALAGDLRGLARDRGCGLLVTTSRRTGPHLRAALAELAGEGGCILWSGPDDGPNPYLGFLGLADRVVVTSDSVNMVCEACATGKPVHVIPLGRAPRRRRRFLDTMVAEGYIRWFDGRLGVWDYPPLRETERVAGVLRARLVQAGVTMQVRDAPT